MITIDTILMVYLLYPQPVSRTPEAMNTLHCNPHHYHCLKAMAVGPHWKMKFAPNHERDSG